MRNLKLVLEYDGTNYSGWQIQAHQRTSAPAHQSTIQETLEKVLSEVLQEKIKVIASGRTDARVHALGQVVTFRTSSLFPLAKLQLSLNSLLPKDIAILKVKEVSDDFHARFSAKSKVYRYLILNQPSHSPLLKDRVFFCPYLLDIKLMRSQARSLLGRHDFRAFAARQSVIKETVRTISKISISRIKSGVTGYNMLAIDIEANGFLYNMVRNIVGTLIDIGRGNITKHNLREILLSKDRRLAGAIAPANGLYLRRVKY